MLSQLNLGLKGTSKRSLALERWSETALPVASVLLEGGVVGVIAGKVYAVSPATLALITATPMFANITSLFWNRITLGRAKVMTAVLLQMVVIACVLCVALTSASEAAVSFLIASMLLSRVVIAGIITVRSVIWSLNYARHQRAKATGQLQMIGSVITVLVSFSIGPILDASPQSLGWIYAVGTLFGSVGIVIFSRIQVVGEAQQLQQEREDQSQRFFFKPALEILRGDYAYRKYQTCMFAAGFGNMLIEAPLIFYVTRELSASYTLSLALTMVIPFAVSLISLPIWASYLDRVHVARFRARQSVIWVLAQIVTFLGAMLGSITGLVLGRFIMGIARGGGSLAWQLGHNDFAPKEQLSAYMSLHVTLTGIRGAIAPFIGMLLYAGTAGWDGMGVYVFALAAMLSAWAGFGFNSLHRQMRSAGTDQI